MGPFKVDWRDYETLRKQLDEDAARPAEDLQLIVTSFRDEPTGRPKVSTVVSLSEFQKSMSGFLVADAAWTLVNVSNMVRQMIVRREETEGRRGRSRRT